MKDEKKGYRIVNKSKDEVTVNLLGREMTWSWDEFNKSFSIKDGYWAIVKPDAELTDDIIKSLLQNIAFHVYKSSLPDVKDTKEEVYHLESMAKLINRIKDLKELSDSEIETMIQNQIKETNKIHAIKSNQSKQVKTYTPSARQALSDYPQLAEVKSRFMNQKNKKK